MPTPQPLTSPGAPTSLVGAASGRRLRILRIDDAQARARCIRFGIGEGAIVSAERLRLGPVLVRHAASELALGRELASQIVVEEQPAPADQARAPRAGKAPAWTRVLRGRGASRSQRR